MTSMNEQGISVKHMHDRGDHRTADRIEGHIQAAGVSALSPSHLEEVLDSTALVGKGARTAYLLAADKMVYWLAFF